MDANKNSSTFVALALIQAFRTLSIIGFVFASNVLIAADASRLEDGVYVLKDATSESKLTTPGGYPVEVDRKLKPSEYQLNVKSISNWNDKFEVLYADDLDRQHIMHTIGIVVRGKMIVDDGGNHDFLAVGRGLADGVAGLVGNKPILRRHPGHRLAIRFGTDKAEYRIGEPIKVSVSIKNVGDNAVAFLHEGPSDEVSSNVEISRIGGSEMKLKEVVDRRSKVSFVGGVDILKAGETIVLRKEDLLKWYVPVEVGDGDFMGSYHLQFYDSDAKKQRIPIWEEWICETFEIHVSP